MTWAVQALESNDAAQLFRVIDERTRHAMISIVQDRGRAASVIQSDYPPAERETALAALGDAKDAADAAALFAMRCDSRCLDWFRARIGAPVATTEDGAVTRVETSRGHEIELYRPVGSDGWYGIVWQFDDYDRERSRANRDFRSIEANAEVYRRRDALEGGGSP